MRQCSLRIRRRLWRIQSQQIIARGLRYSVARRRWRRGGCGAAIPFVAPDNGAGGMDDASVAALEKVRESPVEAFKQNE